MRVKVAPEAQDKIFQAFQEFGLWSGVIQAFEEISPGISEQTIRSYYKKWGQKQGKEVLKLQRKKRVAKSAAKRVVKPVKDKARAHRVVRDLGMKPVKMRRSKPGARVDVSGLAPGPMPKGMVRDVVVVRQSYLARLRGMAQAVVQAIDEV